MLNCARRDYLDAEIVYIVFVGRRVVLKGSIIIIIIMFNFILAKLSWMMAVSGHFKDYICWTGQRLLTKMGEETLIVLGFIYFIVDGGRY